MILYALATTLSSFLLFLVEPMLARHITPWFGGSTSVWLTALVFFQVMLIAGYLYAHCISSFLPVKRQPITHLLVLAASLATIPVIPTFSFWPEFLEQPSLTIFIILLRTVGLPFLLLAATTPLVQRWYVLDNPGGIPYRLFAVSNASSLLALFAYPVAMEPLFTIVVQEKLWSLLYLVQFILFAIIAWKLRNTPEEPAGADADGEVRQPGLFDKLSWLFLATCGALLLGAITNVTNDTVSMPLFWVIPLGLYLLSFCLTFGPWNCYRRTIFLPLFAVSFVTVTHFVGIADTVGSYYLRAFLFSLSLFCCCMVCHGELARLKPSPRFLTVYYLVIAVGGALGGFFVAIVAPVVFTGHYEVHVALALTTGTVATMVIVAQRSLAKRLTTVGAALLLLAFGMAEQQLAAGLVQRQARNFYGRLTVDELPGEDRTGLKRLMHGGINHGAQYLEPSLRTRPVTYYGPDSGVALAILTARPPRQKVGVVGLGVGSVAAYGRGGDQYRFYEINPLVASFARTEFTFLSASQAKSDIVLGDARLSLAREAPQEFDVLVIDAFSGDSIPVHLITREALALYFRHLEKGGVLALHVSSQYLRLEPVIARGLASLGKAGVMVENKNLRGDQLESSWILASETLPSLKPPTGMTVVRALQTDSATREWTDEYSNPLSVLVY